MIQFKSDRSERVDKYLSTYLSDYTRSYIQKMIKDENIRVNGKAVKAGYKLNSGDVIEVDDIEPVELDVIAEDIPIDIVYEDDELMVVNKPTGMVVHPAPGNFQGTLVNAIMYHCKDRLSSINGVARPGIVHRIDKDTSGLLVICKTDKAHQKIAEQLKDHSAHRIYHALVYQNLTEDQGTIEGPIGRGEKDRKKMAINYKHGKDAVTHYRVIERLVNNNFTYVELKLETGRTHQIRVHMSSIGNPLIGDPLYGPKKAKFSPDGQMLHAKEIGFVHPVSGKYMEFDSPLPQHFQRMLNNLRNMK